MNGRIMGLPRCQSLGKDSPENTLVCSDPDTSLVFSTYGWQSTVRRTAMRLWSPRRLCCFLFCVNKL
jgi:hypothetical protein